MRSRQKRHRRIRAKIKGTKQLPRLCVFKSNKHIYGQLIDDISGNTLVSASDLDIKKNKNLKLKNQKSLSGKEATAYQVGQLIAKRAQEKKFNKIVFDRGGYKYHGRIKAFAQGAREQGLNF